MLNKRLKAISDLVKPCDILFDVGSDHGFLPLNLLINKKIKKAIIGEINEGPLEQAKKNFLRYPTLDVEFILSDGLKSYNNKNLDTVVIAGMGFETIQYIMTQDLEKFKKIPQIILQSNTKIENLRKFLNDHSFMIIDEDIVKDRKYYYPIIKVCFNDLKQNLSDAEILFGPILINKNQSVFRDYLLFCKKVEEKIIIAQNKESSERIQIINNLLDLNENLY